MARVKTIGRETCLALLLTGCCFVKGDSRKTIISWFYHIDTDARREIWRWEIVSEETLDCMYSMYVCRRTERGGRVHLAFMLSCTNLSLHVRCYGALWVWISLMIPAGHVCVCVFHVCVRAFSNEALDLGLEWFRAFHLFFFLSFL